MGSRHLKLYSLGGVGMNNNNDNSTCYLLHLIDVEHHVTLYTQWHLFEYIFTCVWVDYCIVWSDWVGNLAKYVLPAEPVPLVFYHL